MYPHVQTRDHGPSELCASFRLPMQTCRRIHCKPKTTRQSVLKGIYSHSPILPMFPFFYFLSMILRNYPILWFFNLLLSSPFAHLFLFSRPGTIRWTCYIISFQLCNTSARQMEPVQNTKWGGWRVDITSYDLVETQDGRIPSSQFTIAAMGSYQISRPWEFHAIKLWHPEDAQSLDKIVMHK